MEKRLKKKNPSKAKNLNRMIFVAGCCKEFFKG